MKKYLIGRMMGDWSSVIRKGRAGKAVWDFDEFLGVRNEKSNWFDEKRNSVRKNWFLQLTGSATRKKVINLNNPE